MIGVYFGEFPEHMRLWLRSCSYNQKIDFLIFTDQELSDLPVNVKTVKMNLKDFSRLASKKLKIENINIKRAYKCCDFKPVYGVIFEDYVKGYDFWGHCDFDLVFGDILSNIDKNAWKKDDKILPLGHLSFYRNTNEVNERYKLESATANYVEIFTSNKSYAFDEFNGMMDIYERNHFPFYKKRVFADIDSVHKRFCLSGGDKNYRHQLFYWEDGRVFKAYADKSVVKKKEYAYIHFKKRRQMPIVIDDSSEHYGFFVTRFGFIEKKRSGVPTMKEIKKLNPYHGFLLEKYEYFRFRYNNMIRKIKRRLNIIRDDT